MALPTFDNGFFQVTALSFSPSVVAVGETATMSITIKNVSGKQNPLLGGRINGYEPVERHA